MLNQSYNFIERFALAKILLYEVYPLTDLFQSAFILKYQVNSDFY